MRRILITAAALYLLYGRQRGVERRLKLLVQEAAARQLAHEAGMRDWGDALIRQLNRHAERDIKWGDDLVKQVEERL